MNCILYVLFVMLFSICTVIVSTGCADVDEMLDLNSSNIRVYKIDLSRKDPAMSDADTISNLVQKISRRLDLYGAKKSVVQSITNEQGSFILIKPRGIKSIEEIIPLIESRGRLDFREQVASGNDKTVPEPDKVEWQTARATAKDGTEKELTGKYLKPNAQVIVEISSNQPVVQFEFNEEGALLLEQITRRNIGKPLAIVIDGHIISAPTVLAVIEDKGIIAGVTLNEAKNLVILLNSGELNAPLIFYQDRP